MPKINNCGKANSRYQRNAVESDGACSNFSENSFCTILSSLCGCDCDSKKKCSRCVNLIQDPSFESYSFDWLTYNVTVSNTSVYEGGVQAALGPGVATLYQEVSLRGVSGCPLLFSFGASASTVTDEEENPGILIVEISWLDENFNFIGLGLKMVIPPDRLDNATKITFVDQTEVVPKNAAYAKVLFTKGEGLAESGDIIYIDYVILAPMAYKDLVKNGGFEANLTNWTAEPNNNAAFTSSYADSLVDAGNAFTPADGALYQNINIRHFPYKLPFLLSFAVAGEGTVSLDVTVQWVSQAGAILGTGLEVSIPENTLDSQGNYLTYLFVTSLPICGTAFARIRFDADLTAPEDNVRIDQVMFAPILTQNLVLNPSFEGSLNNWEQSFAAIVGASNVYVGDFAAGLLQTGGALWQDVELSCPEGQCYLLSAGLGFRRTEVDGTFGIVQIKVIWLDRYDNELGTGLSIVVDRNAAQPNSNDLSWVPYLGITEPAPEGTAKARILFTKTDGTDATIDIDNVIFARIV